MTLPNKRLLNFAGALSCAGMMAFALYAQYVMLLEPCPLCVFQRIAVILLGIIFLLATLHNPGRKGSKMYSLPIAFAAAAGIGVAGWHVHLQSLPPDQVPSCGPGLEYMLGNFPLKDALMSVFKGSGECAEVAWRLLGLSMPMWVVIGLLALGAVGVWNNLVRD